MNRSKRPCRHLVLISSAIAFFLVLITEIYGVVAEKSEDAVGNPRRVISKRLMAEMSSMPAGEPVAVWVFFRDRGFRNRGEMEEALRERGRRFSSRVIERRSKTLGANIVLPGDLPLRAEYVGSILSSGCSLRHRSRWLNAVSVEATPEAIRRIATLPFVKRIQRVAGMRMIDPPEPAVGAGTSGKNANRPSGGLDYGPSLAQLEQINVVAVHDSGFSGNGVIVMMIDTGFYKDHEALAGQDVIAEWDFVFNDGETQNEPEDVSNQHDHGTATWSALGGYAPGQLIGPAYNASFLLAKTEDLRSETPAEEDNYVAALEWGDSLGVDIASASLAYLDFDSGYPDYVYSDLDGNTAVISVAIDEAAHRGILVCNAMGNWGPDDGSLWTPADADSMIACGAVDPFGQIASFSSRGPTYDGRIKPEVVARGVDTYAASSDGGYGYFGGTSLSTPLVGGSAALVLEAHPEWGPMQIREALMATASRASNPDNAYGSGLIDVLSAIYDQGVELTPRPFSIVSPADGDTVPVAGITFDWSESIDPLGRSVSYKWMISTDSLFTDPVTVWDIPGNSYTYTDTLPEGIYFWKVYAYNNQGFYRESDEVFHLVAGDISLVGDGNPGIAPPRSFGLGQNYPNPFNPRTTISFVVPGNHEGKALMPVGLEIFDIRGRLLRTLFKGELEAGRYQFSWDGRDDSGHPVSSGVYLYRLDAGNWTSARKMVLSK